MLGKGIYCGREIEVKGFGYWHKITLKQGFDIWWG